MLWDQHRERFEAGGYIIRRITYCKFRELTRGITNKDMATIGRLNAKRESGATLDAEETATLTELAGKWPVDDLRGACFIPEVFPEFHKKYPGIQIELTEGKTIDYQKYLTEQTAKQAEADETKISNISSIMTNII